MPTGYTNSILNGEVKSLKGFATLCMRAFGATIHMRDESLDVSYEPRVVGTYHLERLKDANDALNKLSKISDERLIAQAKRAIKSSLSYNKKALVTAVKNGVKLNKMLKEVNAWTPPTPEHVEFKEFMIQQIESTIKHDADTEYYDKKIKEYCADLKKKLSARKIRAQRKADIMRDIAYHTKEHNKEVERVKDSNTWVTDLINSIN